MQSKSVSSLAKADNSSQSRFSAADLCACVKCQLLSNDTLSTAVCCWPLEFIGHEVHFWNNEGSMDALSGSIKGVPQGVGTVGGTLKRPSKYFCAKMAACLNVVCQEKVYALRRECYTSKYKQLYRFEEQSVVWMADHFMEHFWE